MADDFNARAATLHHAAESRRAVDHAGDQSIGLTMAIGELANSLATGLVYVGDQLELIRRELWNARNARGEVTP